MLCFFCNKYWWAMALAWACKRNCWSLVGDIGWLVSVLTSENDWTWMISFLIFDWFLRIPWLPVRVVVGTKNWEFILVASSGYFSPCNADTSARCNVALRSGLTRDLEWIPTLVASVAEYLREFCFLANLFSATDIDSWLSCLPNTGRGSVHTRFIITLQCFNNIVAHHLVWFAYVLRL